MLELWVIFFLLLWILQVSLFYSHVKKSESRSHLIESILLFSAIKLLAIDIGCVHLKELSGGDKEDLEVKRTEAEVSRLPWWGRLRISLPMQGTWVWSLVAELRPWKQGVDWSSSCLGHESSRIYHCVPGVSHPFCFHYVLTKTVRDR